MELKNILEAILFAAQKPLSLKDIRDIFATTANNSEDELVRAFKKVKDEELEELLKALEQEYEQAAKTYRLRCVAGAWLFVSQPEYAPWIKTLVGEKVRPPRLSAPALETLTIIAYRQPITRSEIEQIRGVSVDGTMQTLLERSLVEQSGRAEVVGRPALYSTTGIFLEYFGLASLEDLPDASELRRIPVTKPESLLTVDNGLATAPPDALAPATQGDAAEVPAETAAPSEPAPTTEGEQTPS
ncbi:MAG: SMC-Scp complex subunit ScpB [Verrucomicrobiota bacterium]